MSSGIHSRLEERRSDTSEEARTTLTEALEINSSQNKIPKPKKAHGALKLARANSAGSSLPPTKLSWYRRLVVVGRKPVISKGRKDSSIIAHAGSNFVDKLTYMIKKSNKITRSESDFAAQTVRQASIERNRVEQPLAAATNTITKPQSEPIASSTTMGSTINNNRYALSELKRRFVRRCKRSKAVQFAARQYNSRTGGNRSRPSESGSSPTAGLASDSGDTSGGDGGGTLTRFSQQQQQGGCGAGDCAGGSFRSESESYCCCCKELAGCNSELPSASGSSSMASLARDRELVSKRPQSQTQSSHHHSHQAAQTQAKLHTGAQPLAVAQTAPIAKATTTINVSSSNESSSNSNLNLSIDGCSSSIATTPSVCGCLCLNHQHNNHHDHQASSTTTSGFFSSTSSSSAVGCGGGGGGKASTSSSTVHLDTDCITINSCCSRNSINSQHLLPTNQHQYDTQIQPNSAAAHQLNLNLNNNNNNNLQQNHHHHLTSSSLSPQPPPTSSTTIKAAAAAANPTINSSQGSIRSRSSSRVKLPAFFASTLQMMLDTKSHHHQQPQPQVSSSQAPTEAESGKDDSQQQAKKGSLAASSTASSVSAGSFLSRARNSTINLASLATVTHRFNCSASVGNLWSSYGGGGGGGNQQQRRELAELSGDSRDVKPLDYVAHGAFDQYDDSQCSNNNNNTTITSMEPPLASQEDLKKQPKQGSLFSIGSAPVSRKSSSKEKKKRQQKDAEKVEKLRLLVSYLKSGSSQPLLKPVTLEADEIELAQRYKLHLILCEDCLQQVEVEQQQQQQHQAQQLKPRAPGLTASASTGSILNSSASQAGAPRVDPSPEAWSPADKLSSTQSSTIAGIVINVRRSSEQLPANAASSGGNNNQTGNSNNNNISSPTLAVPKNLSAGHSLNSASSPSIDETTTTTHNSSFYSSGGSSSSSSSDHNLHHFLSTNQQAAQDPHDNSQQQQQNNHQHHHHDHHNHHHHHHQQQPDTSQQQQVASSQQQQQQTSVASQQQQLLCYKCKKPTGRNMSSIMSSADLTATASIASDIDSNLSSSYNNTHEQHQLQQQQPYTTTTTTADAQLPPLHQSTPLSAPHLFDQNSTSSSITTNNNNNNIYFSSQHNNTQQKQDSSSSSGGGQHHHQTSGYNQSTNNTSVLATWIDNEVNSLVNDLEAKSQLAREEKYAKSNGKRKWLSGGSGNSRRNSSGAHST